MVNVSVVICTYNRCESLRETLESVFCQKVNRGLTYEILIVDNNSKDRTKKMVEEFRLKKKNLFRYVFEGQQGVAYARNTGVKNAHGEIVAFLDDDVIASPDWLQAIWNCFQETPADAVGGKVERKWNCRQPRWYSEELGGCLISQDLGSERKLWNSERQHMVGANMAFRKEALERYGYFVDALGRKGEALRGGEDREIFQRFMKKGASIFYEPKAAVAHKVEKERVSRKYMRSWFLEIGKTLGHISEKKWYHRLSVVPFWEWKELFRSLFRYVLAQFKIKSNEAERFASEMWVRYHSGILKESFLHWLPFGIGRRGCAFRN